MSHGNVKVISTVAEYNKELESAGAKLVVIDFFATWCGPCKAITPKYIEFSTTYTNVVFLKVDVDQADELAQKCGITAMPTFQFYKNKERIEEILGANADKLKQNIEKFNRSSPVSKQHNSTTQYNGFALLSKCLKCTAPVESLQVPVGHKLLAPEEQQLPVGHGLQEAEPRDEYWPSETLPLPMQTRAPYDHEGRVLLPPNSCIYECHPTKCQCGGKCKNTVVGRGPKYRVEIFRTKFKGWGLRASERIPKGHFICEYGGELITMEREKAGLGDYLFDLDLEGEEGV